MRKKITISSMFAMKEKKEKIVALTAYDYPFAKMVDESGIHMILVGDSLGMMVQGESTTLPVTMDQAIYHTRIVSKAAQYAMVVGDMPFLSYQTGKRDAIANAGRFLKETGASAVKLEGGAAVSETIKAITKASIPVQAHIGLTPQSVHQMGGFKVQRDEERLINDALEVEKAGAFSVVLEGIPPQISAKITSALKIPTIGIGAGPDCDGQILVLHDLVGINDGHLPKFVKQYAQLRKTALAAMEEYVKEGQSGDFPSEEHCYKP